MMRTGSPVIRPDTGFLTGKQLAALRAAGRDIDARNKARAEAEGVAKGTELLDEHDHLAMLLAASGGRVAAMGWLKAQGADINARDKYGHTPMHEAENQGQTKAANWLAANGGHR